MSKQVKDHSNVMVYLTFSEWIHIAFKSNQSISACRLLGNNVMDRFVFFYSPVSKWTLLGSASILGIAKNWN